MIKSDDNTTYRAKVYSNNLVSIPCTLRYALGIYPGDVLVFTRVGDELRIVVERRMKAKKGQEGE